MTWKIICTNPKSISLSLGEDKDKKRGVSIQICEAFKLVIIESAFLK